MEKVALNVQTLQLTATDSVRTATQRKTSTTNTIQSKGLAEIEHTEKLLPEKITSTPMVIMHNSKHAMTKLRWAGDILLQLWYK